MRKISFRLGRAEESKKEKETGWRTNPKPNEEIVGYEKGHPIFKLKIKDKNIDQWQLMELERTKREDLSDKS